MKILSYNPGHDGAVALLQDGRLVASIETEKDSNYRYSPLGGRELLNAMTELDCLPETICTGGWWPRDHFEFMQSRQEIAGYRGLDENDIISRKEQFLGQAVNYFSSSHERSHIRCAFGMSNLPKGCPCYVLIWEGAIGAFYEIDSDANISLISDVLSQPGNRYSIIYGLADPTFAKTGEHPRFSDAGKLMALASFSKRNKPTVEEKKLLNLLLDKPYQDLSGFENLQNTPHFNVGLEDTEFRNFAGIHSNAIFDKFYHFAEQNLKKGLPLLIAGGCGLNCDWNSKWKETGIFSEVFVPPVANDSGSAIGTAIDAQLYFTGNPKIKWDVYSGLTFNSDTTVDLERYKVFDVTPKEVAELLSNDFILGWVSGRYEIGPRALGNRSILAAPFKNSTRERLNKIKQREQFRPIAPICLESEASNWFGCNESSEHMLYTYQVTTEALPAVTHVNGTARIQTVTEKSNQPLNDLLEAFRKLTGFGVLCNTSLNFNGRGFINNISDLDTYTIEHELDGFFVEGRIYLNKKSERFKNCHTLIEKLIDAKL